MKKILSFILTLFLSVNIINADPVKYIGCVPENGSSISSFDFTLNFDIADAIASLGEGEWGLGYTGSLTTGRYVSLYEGTQENGTELATTLTENFTGKSEGFELNGSSVPIKFPLTLKPEVGKTYTLVIRNSFAIFQLGKPTPKSTTYLKFESEPLVLTFTGASASSAELVLQECSINDGAQLKSINNVSFSFNENIAVEENARVSILEGSQVVYESSNVTVSSDNPTVLSAIFSEDVKLLNGHNYKLVLPSGIVSLASDKNVVNKEFSINLIGDTYEYYSVRFNSPKNGETGLFETAEIWYNLPEGGSLFKEGVYSDTSLKVYTDEISDENLVASLVGTPVQNNTGLQWNLNKLPFEPSKTYILYRPEGLGILFDNGVFLSGWTNEESIINFTTPSFEESGLAPLEFQVPEIINGNETTSLTSGQKISFLSTVQIALKDLKYSYGGKLLTLWVTPETKYCLYDITGGSETLVEESVITLATKETTTQYYSVLNMVINQTLFEGHKYKLVIPENEITVSDPLIQNYVRNSEWSIELEGGTPTETVLNSCTLQNNAELSVLPVVIWEFNGEYVQNPELKAILHQSYELAGKPVDANFKVTTLTTNGNNSTTVAMLNYDGNTGEPKPLKTNYKYEVILPEGIIYYPTDPEIKNPEMRYTIIPVEKKPDVVEPEFVNLSISINGLASATQPTVKGQPVTVKLTPSADWKLEKLTRNGNDVIDFVEDGYYTTPALTANTSIDALVEYNGMWAVEISTNVWEIKESNISIYAEGGKIIVSGVTPESEIMVYGVNGMLVNSARSSVGMDQVMISVATGHTYIVVVDGKAAKIQL